MAISDVDVFAHLTAADIENLAVELDAIRQDIEDSRGARDARYIRRTTAACPSLRFSAYCPVFNRGVGQQQLRNLGKLRISNGIVDGYDLVC